MISCFDKTTRAARYLALVLLASVVLASCGGGGGGGSGSGSGSGSGNSVPSASILSGVAAVGTPITNGTISVVCAAGNVLSTTTGSTGAWQVTLSGQFLPCAVEVSGGTINGAANMTLYHSIATDVGTVNISPLTDLIVANLTGTATPSVWFAGLSANRAPLVAIGLTSVTPAFSRLSIALSGLTPLSTHNPITTVFAPTAGNVSDDMLIALATALTKTGVTYASLLSNASVPSFAAPVTGFSTALTTAYAGTVSGGGSGTASYTIGGTVTGLTGSVVLQDNGGGNITVAANGAFTFPTMLTSGSAYNVTVLTQPSSQSCVITGGGGTATTNVTNVVVACTNTIVPPPVCTPPQTLVNGQCVTPIPPSDVLTIQPGPITGKDTAFGTVYATNGIPDAAELYIGGFGDTYSDFFEFDLTGSPQSTVVTKVELWLYGSAPNDPGLQMYRISQPWTEAGVTLANNPTSIFYKNMPPVPSTRGWIVTNITDLYKGWKDGLYPNYGIKLMPTSTNQTNGSIASSDSLDPTIRPKLVITASSTTPTCVLPQVPQGGQCVTPSAVPALPPGYVVQGGLTWMPAIWPTGATAYYGLSYWEVANAYCNNLTINGQTGWRLPTKDELLSMANYGALNAGWDVWSSTPSPVGDHYVVYLDPTRFGVNGSVTEYGGIGTNITCVNPGKVPAPTGISATAGNGQVTVSWNVVAATSYNLYRASVSGVTKGNYSSLTGGVRVTGVTSPYIQASLANATTYYFVVTALNANGESNESSQVSATPQVAPLPVGYVVQGGLNWMPVTFNLNWADANTYCTNTIINGLTGWRLPTLTESNAFSASFVPIGGFRNSSWTSSYMPLIWTSTPAGVGSHVFADIVVGNGGSFGAIDVNQFGVTCVH